MSDSIECKISMRGRWEKQALYEEHLDTLLVSSGTESPSPIKRVGSYADYVNAHDRIYGGVLPPNEDARFLNSDPYHRGYDITTVGGSSGSFLESNVDLLREQPKYHIRSLGERLDSLLENYISGLYAACDSVWNQHYNSIDYVIWNIILKKDGPGLRVPYSMSWHYDIHYPKRYFKILIGLNAIDDHGGGTELLDGESSEKFTDATGYIGLGVNRRTSEIAFREEFRHRPRRFSPGFADALLFWPKRVLHRGLNPERAHRLMLFVSACPVPRSLRPNRQALTGVVFRKAMKSRGPYDTPIWWGFAGGTGSMGASQSGGQAKPGAEAGNGSEAIPPQGQPGA